MESHVKVVGVLYVILGVLGVIAGLALFGLIAGAGAISGDRDAFFITGTIGTIIGAFIVIMSLPSILGGIGVLRRRNWGRVLTIVLSFINLLGFPIGTAIGAYSLWVLLNDQSRPLFR
ncbi:MAG TPA: hypothetical protein VNL91_04755 [Thermoanaerobaculia bacterium]|nr:hypothetical protein [Thermoanaerobaculia bacterium]